MPTLTIRLPATKHSQAAMMQDKLAGTIGSARV
jgi:hypothetical protein